MDGEKKTPFSSVVDKTVIELKKQENISLHGMEHALRVLQFTQIQNKNLISKDEVRSLFNQGTGEHVTFIDGMYFSEQHNVGFKYENGSLVAEKCPVTESAIEFCKQHKIQFNHLL